MAVAERDTIRIEYDFTNERAQDIIYATDPEVIIEGPAGCIAGEARLYLPLTDEHVPIRDLVDKQIAPVVMTMNGPRQATIPFRKGFADLYRIVMDNGSEIITTLDHRVATDRGWTYVAAVQPGMRLAISGAYRPQSTSGRCRSMLPSGDPHSMRTVAGSQCDCLNDHRCDGEQLPTMTMIYRDGVPSRYDVHEHTREHWRWDGQAYVPTNSRTCLASVHPSTLGYSRRTVEMDGMGSHIPQCVFLSGVDSSGSLTLFPRVTDHRHTSERSCRDSSGIGSCFTSTENYRAQWGTVQTLEYVRTDEYFDLHVPVEEHYLAEGIWHHNTGKTLAMMWHVHLCLLKFPGSRVLLFRKVGQDLTTGALDTYHKGVRPDTVGVKTYGGSKFLPAQYQYPNGSVLIPAGLDKADKVLSAEYDMAVGNELTNGITEHDWQTVKTRLRNGKMPFQQLIGDCNPGHVRHWANVRCSEGKARRIVTRHQDNPAYWDKLAGTWTPVGKRYVQETLGSLTGVQRERLLHGKWASAEGLVYPDFNPDEHIKTIDTTGWRKVCGVDVGGVNPTVIVLASISSDDRIHVDQVIYRENLRSSEAINEIIHTHCSNHHADTVFIDPSAAATIGDMRKRGLNVSKADNRIEPGIQRVQSYIKRDALTLQPEACIRMEDEFGEYAYPAKSKPGNENPVKDNDHTMDALRYVTMGVSKPVFDLKQFFEVI